MLRTPLRSTALLVTVTIALGFRVAHTRADVLYVDNNNSTSLGAVAITRIDTTTGVQTPFVTTVPGGTPGPLALDSAGNLYVGVQPVNGSTPFIEKYTPAGVGSLFATLLPGLTGPSGMSFDNAGNLDVSLFVNGVEKVTPGGAVSLLTSNVSNPFGLVISPLNGNLYTVSTHGALGGPIQQITPGGVVSNFFNLTANRHQMAFDNAGNLYTPDPTNSSRMDKITPGGVVSLYATTLIPNSGASQGMAFDSAGNLYVDEFASQSIEKIAPDGTVSPFVTIGTSSNTSLQYLADFPTTLGRP